MKIEFVCGCGMKNYNLNDWLCHFQHNGFWCGMRNLLLTCIHISR